MWALDPESVNVAGSQAAPLYVALRASLLHVMSNLEYDCIRLHARETLLFTTFSKGTTDDDTPFLQAATIF